MRNKHRYHVVDLADVEPGELEGLWEHEVRLWREHLFWDVSDGYALLRRVMQRGGVRGKAIRMGPQTVGYAYYVVLGRLGVLAGLSLAPEWSRPDVGEPLLQATLGDMWRQGAFRIQSQFVAFNHGWLSAAFEREGFRTYWREFLRLPLHGSAAPAPPAHRLSLQPWQGADVREAAAIMHAAYEGEIDAEMDTMYRSVDGCRIILDNILSQHGSGKLVGAASVIARHRQQDIGFSLLTEIAPRQAHLAQIVVLPAYQRRGVGRWLLRQSMARLAAREFDTLSLFVSRANVRALGMYQAMGFAAIRPFPVFAWERESTH